MINFNTGQQAWPPTFDQEGNEVTQQMVMQENVDMYQAMIEEKREDFEKALEAKCRRDDEVYRKIGFEPRVGMICYQVGMGIFGIQARPDGMYPIKVGQIQ